MQFDEPGRCSGSMSTHFPVKLYCSATPTSTAFTLATFGVPAGILLGVYDLLDGTINAKYCIQLYLTQALTFTQDAPGISLVQPVPCGG